MMEALLLEVETIKRNSDKCKISTPTPRAALMVATVAMVDAEEVAGAIDGTDIPSRV